MCVFEPSDLIFPGDVTKLRNMHEVEMDLPDECYFLLQAAMLDNGYAYVSAFKELRDYVYEHIPDEVLMEVYRYHKRALQCIFYKGISSHLFCIKNSNILQLVLTSIA